jgi:hypothetical protein
MAKSNHSSVYFDRMLHSFVGLEGPVLQELKDAYPTLDVESELRKMKLWLELPKGKRRQGHIGFIINWLNNATPSEDIPSVEKQLEFLNDDSFLASIVMDYLKDLWKGREHLLNFNSVARK